MKESDEYVFPGKFLGTEEEFIAGAGTFVEEGRIIATVCGKVRRLNRVISVSSELQTPKKITIGSPVYGRVEELSPQVAFIRLQTTQGLESRQTPIEGYAILHISKIRRGFVENIRDELRIGDIIKAKVVEIRKGEIHLSTIGKDLGVIKAFCFRCRGGLYLSGKILKCERCGSVEKRRISSEYSYVR